MPACTHRVITAHYRRLVAGILEVPPAMHAAIYEWVLAVAAASDLVRLDGLEKEYRNYRNTQRQYLGEFQDALAALKRKPSDWKLYKAAHELAWAFGHPGTRMSIREFQKMTPEKRSALEAKMLRWIAGYEERIEERLSWGEREIPKVRAEKARLRPYLRTGVKALDRDSAISKKFPVDFTDWKYGGEALLEEMREKATGGFREFMERATTSEQKAMIEKIIEDTLAGLREITVSLTFKSSVSKARAHWNPMKKSMEIVLPREARPYELNELGRTLRHELQHFSQQFLGIAKGYDVFKLLERAPMPGMPSKKIKTPEFSQNIDPRSKDQTPEARALLRRLKNQGIHPTTIDFHALDDLEFYSRLADAVDRFKRTEQRVGAMPRATRQNAIKLFTAAIPYPNSQGQTVEAWAAEMRALGGYDIIKNFEPSGFFKTLKRMAPGKWRKAVGEFVKAVL